MFSILSHPRPSPAHSWEFPEISQAAKLMKRFYLLSVTTDGFRQEAAGPGPAGDRARRWMMPWILPGREAERDTSGDLISHKDLENGMWRPKDSGRGRSEERKRLCQCKPLCSEHTDFTGPKGESVRRFGPGALFPAGRWNPARGEDPAGAAGLPGQPQ